MSLCADRLRPIKPLLLLLFLAPFIGEVLSSNVPASLFVAQPVMILFGFLTYSLPVLLIRDSWVGRNLSLWALLMFGVAYGIFNEGLLARTLLMPQGLPIPTFDHYLLLGGLNGSWALTLLVWHAIFSVATPIFVTHWLFPETARTRWLPRGWFLCALFVAGVTSLLFFRTDQGPAPSGAYYLLFVATIGILCAIAARSKAARRTPWAFSWIPLLAGLAFFVLFGGLFVISGLRLAATIFVGYALGILAVFVWYVRRLADVESGLVLFCIGSCISYSVFVFFAKMRLSVEGILVSSLLLGSYTLLVRRARSLAMASTA